MRIVGENGIDKSTLARLCVGLEQPQRGDILLDGKKSGKRERIRKSYYVMQDADYQLFSDSVLGELTIGREGEAAANEAARQILDRLGCSLHSSAHCLRYNNLSYETLFPPNLFRGRRSYESQKIGVEDRRS